MQQLLQEWSIWLFKQDGSHSQDAASDRQKGQFVTEHNKNRNPWFIPGTWGQVSIPARELHVQPGTELFIVAASSHATNEELDIAGETVSDANLKKHAQQVDELWYPPNLSIGQVDDKGRLPLVELEKVVTPPFDITINPNSPYCNLAGIAGGNSTRMVTMGHVHKFTPGEGKTRIVIAAQSPKAKIGRREEKQYNVHVEYIVEV